MNNINKNYDDFFKTNYYFDLNKSYNKVGQQIFELSDFSEDSLITSRNIFTKKSIENRKPKPRKFEIYALLSGLSFNSKFVKSLAEIQHKIDNIIDGSLRYFVFTENLGIEHCVFKWQNNNWTQEKEKIVCETLDNYKFVSFDLIVKGVQIHPDGCIVAKGYDCNGEIQKIRSYLKEKINFFPHKQSQWAHIPLGRILEPIGQKKFIELKNLIKDINEIEITSTKISTYKFIHEERWYMEETKLIKVIEV